MHRFLENLLLRRRINAKFFSSDSTLRADFKGSFKLQENGQIEFIGEFSSIQGETPGYGHHDGVLVWQQGSRVFKTKIIAPISKLSQFADNPAQFYAHRLTSVQQTLHKTPSPHELLTVRVSYLLTPSNYIFKFGKHFYRYNLDRITHLGVPLKEAVTSQVAIQNPFFWRPLGGEFQLLALERSLSEVTEIPNDLTKGHYADLTYFQPSISFVKHNVSPPDVQNLYHEVEKYVQMCLSSLSLLENKHVGWSSSSISISLGDERPFIETILYRSIVQDQQKIPRLSRLRALNNRPTIHLQNLITLHEQSPDLTRAAIASYVEGCNVYEVTVRFFHFATCIEALKARYIHQQNRKGTIVSRSKMSRIKKGLEWTLALAIQNFGVTEPESDSILRKVPELNRESIRNVLEEMCQTMSIETTDLWPEEPFGFLRIRNRLIHEGISPGPNILWEESNKLKLFAERVFSHLMQADLEQIQLFIR